MTTLFHILRTLVPVTRSTSVFLHSLLGIISARGLNPQIRKQCNLSSILLSVLVARPETNLRIWWNMFYVIWKTCGGTQRTVGDDVWATVCLLSIHYLLTSSTGLTGWRAWYNSKRDPRQRSRLSDFFFPSKFVTVSAGFFGYVRTY
jgi:hypothetical protein